MSDILKIVMQNSKYSDAEADAKEHQLQQYQDQNLQKAMQEMSKDQTIQGIPTQNPKIEQKTESHKQFKNYDHSLEQNRSKLLGLKSKDGFVNENGEIEYDDGIIMGDMGSDV